MYRLSPNSTSGVGGGCPKFSVPILEKLECDKAVCSAMAPGNEMNPYNVDNKEGAGAGKYHVRAAAPSPRPSAPPTPRPRSPGSRARSARTTTSGRRAATARPTRPTSRTRSTAPTRRWCAAAQFRAQLSAQFLRISSDAVPTTSPPSPGEVERPRLRRADDAHRQRLRARLRDHPRHGGEPFVVDPRAHSRPQRAPPVQPPAPKRRTLRLLCA